MVRHRLNVVAVVFNDGAFGNVLRMQREAFGGRTIGSDLLNPDFVRLAEAFGIDGARVDGPQALRRALEQALARDRPAVIEVPIGEVKNLRTVVRPGYRG
jgi:acetolactate synthase-1/2/3 large subunit